MPGQNLTRAEAQERAAIVNPSHYDIVLDVRGEKTFSSVTTITFTATEGASTFVDLIAPSVNSITLNGEDVDVSAYSDSRIALSGLKAENTLVVDATCAFMNTGEGMHRFVDPVDGETYLYTQFEVADARRVYANFEQPDLKATYAFTITAPDHWKVFSNAPSPEPTSNGDGSATWAFSDSEIMSTYLTAIIAGPYEGGEGSWTAPDGRVIPMGVYARASLSQYLDVEEVLDITYRGFAFFEKEFDTPYPFRKYDQVFVPEFNAGAMENCGAVTHTESYVFRSRATGAMIERRAITILHELAHMWFGDLVTMKWWNDLWLNESFAEFMSHLAADEATRWDQAWQTFLASEKSWAMNQDELSSTHPIVSTVANLDEVWANFDGITYGKGASVLKQLVAYVGRKEFMTGLAEYFAKHSWSNTELTDLLVELEKASGRDLGEWSKLWLEESGLTVASPIIELDGDTITRLAIKQELGNAANVRPHRIGIGLYDLRGDTLALRESHTLDVAGEITEVEHFVGQKKADLVLVNDQDLGYTKIRLDEDSLATAINHIDGFEDRLARTLVLAAAWDMVVDALMPASDYIDLVLRAIATEDHPTVLRVQLMNLAQAVKLYSAPANRTELADRATAALLEIADNAEAGSELQFQTTLAVAGLASSDAHLDRLEAWLEGNDLPTGFEVDTDARWQIVAGLAAAGRLDEAQIEAELEADKTATGAEAAWRARAGIPTSESKERAFTALVEDGDLPNMQQRNALIGFRAGKPEVLVPFFDRYLDSLEKVWDKQTYEMAKQLATVMFPTSLIGHEGVDVEAKLQGWLDAHEDAAPALRRTIIEHLDLAKRAGKTQQLDAR